MKSFSNETLFFLELLKSGLWGTKCTCTFQQEIDWEQIWNMAKAQTVAGIVIDGCLLNGIRYNRGERREERGERLPSEMQNTNVALSSEKFDKSEQIKQNESLNISASPRLCVPNQVPKEVWFRLVKEVARVEDANKRMNAFLPKVFRKLHRHRLHPWLLKGQGVGMCYPNPLHRTSGDIDLFFPIDAEYEKAGAIVSRIGEGEESKDTKEWVFPFDGILLELHGRIVAWTNKKLKKQFPLFVQRYADQTSKEPVVDVNQIVVPPVNFDAIFIFVHTMRHYFGGGIGLRQVSDWMRYLFYHQKEIDETQLVSDIENLGLKKIWQVFGAMAVEWLGCPKEVMPLYDIRYSKEGETVLKYILQSGNFGYYDERLQNRPDNFYLGKLYSFWGQAQMILRNVWMFPEESLRALPDLIKGGVERVAQKK